MSKVFETTPVDTTLIPLQRACGRLRRPATCAVMFVLAATLGCETDTASSYRVSG
jgi:hypothetical protein